MSDLTHEEVKKILDYDSDAGVLTWKIRAKSTRPVGSLAGITSRKDGYLDIGIRGKRYLTHRIIWFWMTGEWPENEVDHINGDKADNQWKNHRAATRHQNIQNRGPHADNLVGLKGVTIDKRRRKYQAQIYAGGRKKFLGYFDCPAAAHFAYFVAAESLHGEFARTA